MEKRQIPTDAELNAIVNYDATFPFILSIDDLDEYNKGFVNWHKQPTIEISIVYEGAVSVNVLENSRIVTAGDGFLIMPGYLHSIRPAEGYTAAKYYTLIFHPRILYGFRDSFFELTYYRPMVSANAPCYLFGGDEAWTGPLYEKLAWIRDNYSAVPQTRLAVQRLLQDAWMLLAGHLTQRSKQVTTPHNTKKILDLVGYIHAHHAERFSLSDMAKDVSMSRNECCRYFKKMMNMTITEYLTEHRLAQALALLETSNLSITEIAQRVGFCDASYFIKVFRQMTGVTPKAYARHQPGKREML